MRNITLIIIFLYLTIIGHAQSNVKFDNVISLKVSCNKTMDFDFAPKNTDFIITNAEFVNDIVNKLIYWDELYDSTFTKTLVIYESDKADSVLVVENVLDRYSYKRENGKWLIQNFTIRSTHFTLNHIAVGLTSKEVFKILNKKIKSKVGKGQVWLLNESQTRLILTFYHNKVISMKL